MTAPPTAAVRRALGAAAAWPVPHAAVGAAWLAASPAVAGVAGRAAAPTAGPGHVGAGLAAPATATWGAVARVQPWASVTKVLTALAVLVAAEEGTVDLDEPAGPPGSTVRHLLAHASGLGPAGQVLTSPGRRRIYSNAGFDMLGALVARKAGMPFAGYLAEGVLQPLGMAATELPGGASPASGARGTLDDLVRLAGELLAPRLVAPQTLSAATDVAFPRLAGVVPGIGRFDPCDWGLGFERRGDKDPHWTGRNNGAGTFGHFGRSGSFVWVDPDVGCAAAALTGREFGPWALEHWPPWSDGVLASLGRG